MNTIVIIFNNELNNTSIDLEVPLDISANDLVIALNCAYNLGIDTTNQKKSYLKAENPFVLLRGSKKLSEFGLHNGSIINFTKQEGR